MEGAAARGIASPSIEGIVFTLSHLLHLHFLPALEIDARNGFPQPQQTNDIVSISLHPLLFLLTIASIFRSQSSVHRILIKPSLKPSPFFFVSQA